MAASAQPTSLASFAASVGLSNFYPDKLTTADAIAIGSSGNGIGWQLIRQLICCNSKARDEAKLQLMDSAPARAEEDEWDEEEAGAAESEFANPIDVLLATLACCDADLKQLLCQKLFTCKLAFPFAFRDDLGRLVTNEWSLRAIAIEFKDREGRSAEIPIFSDRPIQCVAFVRAGTHDISKSKLLNLILSDENHQTFFNRESPKGSTRLRCSSGLIEASVFLPSGGSKSDPFLALNLRGDVSEHPQQTDLLSKCASVVICMALADCVLQIVTQLKLLAAETNRLILILTKRNYGTQSNPIKDSFREQMGQTWSRMSTVPAYKNKVTKTYREILSDVTKAIETANGDRRHIVARIAAAESCFSSSSCQVTQRLACDVTKHFSENKDVTKFKDEFLSLHMDLWQEYSKLHKKEHSSSSRKEDLSKVQTRKIEFRNLQVARCKELSPIMKGFLSGLETTLASDGLVDAAIFLEGLRLQFYELCLEHVPALQKAYVTARQALNDCQCDTEVDGLKEACRIAEKRVANASLDLNSLFREAGQIYEASQENSAEHAPSISKQFECLPRLFAKLLLLGIPMEILDGDACNVPEIWVSAVLQACHDLAGRKKLFVLSVLGVQSTGKSTLLNTMFGLRFPVSAGRCTRGAYLQLIRVSDPDLPFDYVAIIDTEGLKAPELGSNSPHHDNELATLVIGLGDVSVINMKGENSSDMKEILPIAVHAFLRMRQVNKKLEIHRSCIFVHQNVSAVSAKEKMKEAIAVMRRNLDEFTREAAEGEGLLDIRFFHEIISFDSDNGVFFMPDLWFGDPPVASVNVGYSLKVQEIREYVLSTLSKKQKTFIDFHDFKIRIGDMWKAIMSEDFVFSFRNSVEMKAYHLMELAFIDCKDTLDDFGIDWLHKTAFVRIKKTSSDKELALEGQSLHQEMIQSMSTKFGSVKTQLEKYFEEDSYKEYSVQWKPGKLLALNHVCEERQEGLRDRMKDAMKIQRLEIELSAKREHWERIALNKAKELARTLTGSGVSDEDVKANFDLLWLSIIDDLPSEQVHFAEPIDKQIENLLYELFHKDGSILQHHLQKTPVSSILSDNDATPFVSECLNEIRYSNESAPPAYNKASTICDAAFDCARQLLQDMSKRQSGFYIADVRKILSEVARIVREKRHDLASDGISLPVAFEIKLAIGVCRHALPAFISADQLHQEQFSIKARLEALKEKIWNMFKNMVSSKASEKTAADFVRDHLAKVIKETVSGRMLDELRKQMKREIANHKHYLILMMLTEWTDRDDFKSIISYVKDSKLAALKWVTAFVDKFLFTKRDQQGTKFAGILESAVAAPIFKMAIESCEGALKKMKDKAGPQGMKQWSEEFCQLFRELAVKPDDFMEMFNHTVTDIADFSEYLKQGLQVKMKELTDELNGVNEASVRWPGSESLYSLVLDSLWGCDAQCPFCNEPCSRAVIGHHNDGDSHKCIQHRPTGVAGIRMSHSNQIATDTCGYDVDDKNRSFNCSICQKYRRPEEQSTSECDRGPFFYLVFHPFREYKKFFPSWDIAPDPSNSGSKYWMWFVWTFRSQLKAEYGYKIDDIPSAWQAVSKEAAKQSLRVLLD